MAKLKSGTPPLSSRKSSSKVLNSSTMKKKVVTQPKLSFDCMVVPSSSPKNISPSTVNRSPSASTNIGSSSRTTSASLGASPVLSKSNIRSPTTASVNTGSSSLMSSSLGASPILSKSKNVSDSINSEMIDNPYGLYDMIWGKVPGYAFWPGIVTVDNHSGGEEGRFYNSGTKELHVQFFGAPPSRAWVNVNSLVIPFTGNKNILPDKVVPPKLEEERQEWLDSIDAAARAIDVSPQLRSKLLDISKNKKQKIASSKSTPSRPVKEAISKKKCSDVTTISGKRRRVITSESDDSEGFIPNDEDYSSENDDMDDDVSEKIVDSEPAKKLKLVSAKKNVTPVRKSSTTPLEKTNTLRSPKNIGAKLTKVNLTTGSSNMSSSSGSGEFGSHKHCSLAFMQPDKIKDKSGRRPDDPNYDPRTLFVPNTFLESLTPCQRQWWDTKIDNFDKVLFFKVGKFYELFHCDADTGVRELGLIYMSGDTAHCGFPEIGFARYASVLVSKGYKTARVEQTETPEMLKARTEHLKRKTPNDKVVKREICQVLTRGTRTFSFMEGDENAQAPPAANYLMAIKEVPKVVSDMDAYSEDDTYDHVDIGVAFVDTSIGKFFVGQFVDDGHRGRLRTLLTQYAPVQLLTERGCVSDLTSSVIRSEAESAGCLRDNLFPETEFWSAKTTLRRFANNDYFDGAVWPDALTTLLDNGSATTNDSRQSREGAQEAWSALGTLTWYLTHSLLDHDLISMCRFYPYVPIELANKSVQNGINEDMNLDVQRNAAMIMDATTLHNLEVTENSLGSSEGTLLRLLDHCVTPFGRREFRRWVCAPLLYPAAINERLDAVSELMSSGILESIRKGMTGLPDLERTMRRIHALGSKHRNDASTHPDARAIMYDEEKYGVRKVKEITCCLEGFKAAMSLLAHCEEESNSFTSLLLRSLMRWSKNGDGGAVPDVRELLRSFDDAFDHKLAEKKGLISPNPGADEEFDAATKRVRRTERALDSYLEEARNMIRCPEAKFFHGSTAKAKYQLEVPVSTKVPDNYEKVSGSKLKARYHTAILKSLMGEHFAAEEASIVVLAGIRRRMFARFDQHYDEWDAVVQCLQRLDCLQSLAYYSGLADGSMCRPEFVDNNGIQPFFDVRGGHHPCLANTFSGGAVIPNSLVIGSSVDDQSQNAPSCILVTGPNMGGKSTLLRQNGLFVIMAQLGCYVPAESLKMTPVDRIFTRLGANDRIMSGESTFFVELRETSDILRAATQQSFVLLDELGRGTATFDGTSIASAVVHYLADEVGCRMLFATHYHTLIDEFEGCKNVGLSHMGCIVPEASDTDEASQTIEFTYELAAGACPKSYGFNVARLAGMPSSVVSEAYVKAAEFEENFETLVAFRRILHSDDPATSIHIANTAASTWKLALS